jgi:hypothetical protein
VLTVEGELEHFIVSNVKKAIPQSFQDKWHEYRKALQEARKESLGEGDLGQGVEMAGWGVEEAEARNKAEASKFLFLLKLIIAFP